MEDMEYVHIFQDITTFCQKNTQILDFPGQYTIRFSHGSAATARRFRRNVVVNGFDLGEALLEDGFWTDEVQMMAKILWGKTDTIYYP